MDDVNQSVNWWESNSYWTSLDLDCGYMVIHRDFQTSEPLLFLVYANQWKKQEKNNIMWWLRIRVQWSDPGKKFHGYGARYETWWVIWHLNEVGGPAAVFWSGSCFRNTYGSRSKDIKKHVNWNIKMDPFENNLKFQYIIFLQFSSCPKKLF